MGELTTWYEVQIGGGQWDSVDGTFTTIEAARTHFYSLDSFAEKRIVRITSQEVLYLEAIPPKPKFKVGRLVERRDIKADVMGTITEIIPDSWENDGGRWNYKVKWTDDSWTIGPWREYELRKVK